MLSSTLARILQLLTRLPCWSNLATSCVPCIFLFNRWGLQDKIDNQEPL